MPPTNVRVVEVPLTGIPNPLLLPVASSQAPLFSTYDALNVPGQAAGFSYLDPFNGSLVRIWKLTSATVPSVNTYCNHGYAEYGPFVSRAWGSLLKHTIMFKTSSDQAWLVDFERGVGFSNYRQITGTIKPDGDTGWCWSNVIGTEQIGYAFNNSGGTLRKVNTAPATPVEVVSGFFPKAGFGTGFVAPQVMQDKDDTWFVGGNSSTGGTQHAWNSVTGVYLTKTPSPAGNDTRILRGNGLFAYIQLTDATYSVWDLTSDTITGNYPFSTFGSHPGAAQKYTFSHVGTSFIYTDMSTIPPTVTNVPGGGGAFSHNNGSWIQTGPVLDQWITGARDESVSQFNFAVGYVRLGDGDRRILCHHYSDNSNYLGRPFATASPDGRVVLFDSRMNVTFGRTDVFIAEVPLS